MPRGALNLPVLKTGLLLKAGDQQCRDALVGVGCHCYSFTDSRVLSVRV